MARGAPLKNNKLFESQALGNILSISCYELNNQNVDKVITAIKQFNPQFIHAYPSALRILTNCIKDPGRLGQDVQIKAAFLGSEGLSENDRKWFKRFYNTQVVNWYGHSECVLHGGNYPGSDEFYFYPFYGYTELLDEDNNQITEPGEIGRIVGTSFDNYAMPFIRYDTGDLGVLSSKKESPYGMSCVVMKRIEGRSQDIIYLNDKTRVTLTAFIFGQHLPQFSVIREMQLQQDEFGKLLIRLVTDSNWKSNDSESMKNTLTKSVSDKIKIDIHIVKQIPKTHRGKHRFLIQNCTR
jgi:phenylacetate-CoA ligase